VIGRRAFGFGVVGTTLLAAIGIPLAWIDEDEVVLALVDACFAGEGLPAAAAVGADANLRRYLSRRCPRTWRGRRAGC
jgi:hypothetical protein